MALRVWLPLNGNLDNQGLSELTPVNHNCTIANGKIGQCYSFNGSTSYIDIGSACNEIIKGYGQPFTLAFWIKSLENGTRGILFSTFPNTGNINFLSLEENSGSVTSNALRFDWKQNYDAYVPDMFDVNQWVHVSIAYDGNQNIHVYKNGVLKQTLVHQLEIIEAHTKNFWLGNDPRLGGTSFEGFMNDFRIYDECLSPKQIKEISKGLVAHYKLEGTGANPNLLTNSQNTIKPDNADSIIWCNNVTSYNKDTEEDCAHLIVPTTGNPNNGIGYAFNTADTTLSLSHNQIITFSCDIKGTVGTDLPYLAIRMNFGSEGTWYNNGKGYVFGKTSTMEGITKDTFKRYSVTYTIPADNSNYDAFKLFLCIHANYGGNFYIKNIKLELGEMATPWIPNEVDSLYTELGYDKTLITDVSGNGYNGIINGTLTYNNDSPKYTGCTRFNANTSYIKLPTLTTGGFANSFTIIYWAKITDMNGKMAWGFNDGNRLNIYPTGSVICCNTGDGSSNPYQNNGSSIAYSQWNNGWHQFAMVADGSTNKLYVDGQYQGTAKTYKSITGTQMYISGWDAGTSYRWVNGSISDFRIYATALTADDILTLYKTSGIIDNKGNVYSYEFKEE